jgi:hypothetical protein
VIGFVSSAIKVLLRFFGEGRNYFFTFSISWKHFSFALYEVME